ncbi:helix-turn-helix domain-containing protein [Spirosoma soli]|uniref:Helix-turn-helix domain-containing protein n=1 Tax=Spirosoma soli TaxID=1770529 RepID=A0ABW5LWJ3_9BACT
MKVQFEEISPDRDSSFHILLTPHLSDVFLWHHHPEYEIVYIEGASGTRHVGEHISRYEDSDLVFIGPNIPHLNFDYGVKTDYQKVVVQLMPNFLGESFWLAPECGAIRDLFERARSGISFHGQTKQIIGQALKQLAQHPPFNRLLELLNIFQQLAMSEEWTSLHGNSVNNSYNLSEQLRLKRVSYFIAEHYTRRIEIDEVAGLSNLTKAAFCRYFKRMTHLTFTQYLNQYRVNQAQRLLLQNHTVSEACLACGFESMSYFNKTFRRVTGENPLQFKKRHLR